jgi:hypothetical protein
MLERFQAFADNDGLLTAASITVFDADLTTDPVTDAVKRGPLRQADVPLAVRQEIVDFINAKLAGKNKADERLALGRQRVANEKAAEAAKLIAPAEEA